MNPLQMVICFIFNWQFRNLFHNQYHCLRSSYNSVNSVFACSTCTFKAIMHDIISSIHMVYSCDRLCIWHKTKRFSFFLYSFCWNKPSVKNSQISYWSLGHYVLLLQIWSIHVYRFSFVVNRKIKLIGWTNSPFTVWIEHKCASYRRYTMRNMLSKTTKEIITWTLRFSMLCTTRTRWNINF